MIEQWRRMRKGRREGERERERRINSLRKGTRRRDLRERKQAILK